MKQYECRHFVVQELVSPDVYADRGEKAWALLDTNALKTLDALRDKFGSITVNDWYWGGTFKESGLRTTSCEYYRPYSMHSFGKAFDCKFKDTTPEKVQEYILNNADEFPFLQRMEDTKSTKTWLHFDVGNHGYYKPYVFKP